MIDISNIQYFGTLKKFFLTFQDYTRQLYSSHEYINNI